MQRARYSTPASRPSTVTFTLVRPGNAYAAWFSFRYCMRDSWNGWSSRRAAQYTVPGTLTDSTAISTKYELARTCLSTEKVGSTNVEVVKKDA